MKAIKRIKAFFDKIKNSHFVQTIKSPLHTIMTIISWTVFVLLILCAAFLLYYFVSSKIYAKKGAGYEPKYSLYTIISPSMVPNIRVYDVVVVKYIKQASDIKIGDVITFNSVSIESFGKSVTHRVIEVVIDANGNYKFSTKGDNNFIKDSSAVPFENVTGKVVMKIPQLGRVQFFLASRFGWLVAIVIPALYVIIKDIIKIIGATKIGKKVLNGKLLFPFLKKQLLIPHKEDIIIEEKPPLNDLPDIKDEFKQTEVTIFMPQKKNNIKQNIEESSLENIYQDLKDISKNNKG